MAVSGTRMSGTGGGVAKPAAAGAAMRFVLSTLLAIVLVAVVTGVRAMLSPLLGVHSPLMLYIVAVLLAGFARGGVCGLITMVLGGLAGDHLFAAPPGSWDYSAAKLVSLGIYCAVSLPVLGMAMELGRRANAILDRVKPSEEPIDSE